MRYRKSFCNLDKEYWKNLALAAVFGYYLVLIGTAVIQENTLSYLGGDFRAFWSAGKIANQYGLGKIYDLNLLTATQKAIVNLKALNQFAPVPTPFLPIFVIPFRLFALIEPILSYYLWTLINVLILFMYLCYFQKRLNLFSPMRYWLILFLSFAVFQNFFWGQVDVWLVICSGEFLIALLGKKDFYGGIWLGGLLLKPQCLVVILPALLLTRKFKVLIGFLFISILVVGTSYYLIGNAGMQAMLDLWLKYSSGIPTNAPERMMNWRMFGLHIGGLTSPCLGIITSGLATAITFIVTLSLWKNLDLSNSRKVGVILLGTFAATMTIAWHSHEHMSMLLLPIFMLIRQKNPEFTDDVYVWAFAPVAMNFLIYMISLLMVVNVIPFIQGFGAFFLGTTNLVLHLYLLFWAVNNHDYESSACAE